MQSATSPEIKYHIADSKLSIEHKKRKGVTAMPRPHNHSQIELYYLLEGQRVYFVGDQVITLHKGELILISPHEMHSTASSEIAEFERILINFDPSILTSELQNELSPLNKRRFHLFQLSLREQDEITHLLGRMLEECRQDMPFYETYTLSLFTELMILLQRSDNRESPRKSDHPLHDMVTEIATYLGDHYREQITLEEISKHFFVSSSYLSRVFHRLTGFHFREYIIHIRVREAKRLLAESGIRIQEVAAAVGFEHLSHFNKTFKKTTQMTPMQYRKSKMPF